MGGEDKPQRSPAIDARWLPLRLAVYGVALSALWSPLNALLLPELVSAQVATGIRGSAVGLLTFVGIGAAVVVQPLAGAVSDHWRPTERRRPFILVGTCGASAATILLAFAPSFTTLLTAYVVIQCAANVAQASFQALIPDLVEDDQRAVASGYKTGLSVAGNILGLGIVAGLAAAGAPESISTAALGVMVGLSVASLLLVPPTPPAEKPLARRDLLGAFSPLWNGPRAFRLGILMRFLFFLGIYPFQRFLVFFLEDSFGVEEPGLVVSASIVCGIAAGAAGGLAAGPATSALGPRRLLVGVISITALALLAAAAASALWVVLAAGILMGFATGAFQAASWAVLTRAVPEGAGGNYLGIANIATAGAGAAAGLLGPGLDLLKLLVPVAAYPVTFGLAALIAALSLLPALRVGGESARPA